MKLSDLTEDQQDEIKSFLRRTFYLWRSTRWFRRNNTPASQEMRQWCREFIRFKINVERDMDLWECFRIWNGDLDVKNVKSVDVLNFYNILRKIDYQYSTKEKVLDMDL